MKLTQEQRYQLLDIFTAENGDYVSAQMMAKSYGLSDEQFAEFQFKCTKKLIKDFLYSGNSKSYRPEGASENEIKMGLKVEMEHTTNKRISLKIVYDHLQEFSNYYTLLKEMEEKARKMKNNE